MGLAKIVVIRHAIDAELNAKHRRNIYDAILCKRVKKLQYILDVLHLILSPKKTHVMPSTRFEGSTPNMITSF